MKSKRNIKSILVVFAYAVWQLCILSICFTLLINTASHDASFVSYMLTKYTGKEITITKINYDINWKNASLSVHIDDVEITDEKYNELKDLISSEEIIIDLDINSLFSDTVIFRSIMLCGADLNICLFKNGDTFFDKYSDSEPNNLNILIKNFELDSCNIFYSYYDFNIEEFVSTKFPEYYFAVFVDKAEFDAEIYIEDTKNCHGNEYIDRYCFNVLQCCGNLTKFCNNDKEIMNDQNLELQNLEIFYEYISESDSNNIFLYNHDTAYLGRICFDEFLLSMEYNNDVFAGEINGNFTFPVNHETLSFASYLLDYDFDFDSTLLNIAKDNEINSVLKYLNFSWNYNYLKDFVKLFFKSDCSISCTSDDYLFKLNGLKKIDSDFCFIYSYDSLAGVENDSIVIKDLNIKALNSVVFSNKDIILTNENSNSELDLDVGFNADLVYIYQLWNSGIIESLSGRINAESVKIKAFLTDFTDTGLIKLIRNVDIEEAKISSANLKLKDFASEFQSINAILNLKNSNLKISDSDFILNENMLSMTAESKNINSFFDNSKINLSAVLFSDFINLNNLLGNFIVDNDNSVEKTSDNQNTFIDRLNFDLNLVFDSIVYKTEIESEYIFPVLVKKMEDYDIFSLYLDSIYYVSNSEIDLNATNFVSDLLFSDNSLQLSKLSFMFYGAEAIVVGKTVFDSTLSSDYDVQLKNIDPHRVEDETGLSINKFLQSTERIYPHIDSLFASLKFKFEKSDSLVRIAFPEAFVYLSKIDLEIDKNMYVSDRISNFQVDGFDKFVFNTNAKNIDEPYTFSEKALYIGEIITSDSLSENAEYIKISDKENDSIKLSLSSKVLRDFIFKTSDDLVVLTICIEKSELFFNQNKSNFDIYDWKLNLLIDDLLLINSCDKDKVENDTIISILDIKMNPEYNSRNLSVDDFDFKIFNGDVVFHNISFADSSRNNFDFKVESVSADFLQSSYIFSFIERLGMVKDTIYKTLFSGISDFDVKLKGAFSASENYDIIEFSFDGINEMSEYNLDGSLSDFHFKYQDSINAKQTDFDNTFNKREKINRRKGRNSKDDSPVFQGCEFYLDILFSNINYLIKCDSTDILIDFMGKMDESQFEFDYTEGDNYDFIAKNLNLKEFIELSDTNCSYNDFVNNAKISDLQISSDSSNKIIMKFTLDDFSIEAPRIIKFILSEANLWQLMSKDLSFKEIEFNMTMLDTIIDSKEIPIILIDNTHTIINNSFTLLLSGQYYENTLYLNLFLNPVNEFGKHYKFYVEYNDDSIYVSADGRGLLNIIINKLLGKYEDYIIKTLDTSYEDFSKINKTNKKLMKKEKKRARREKRKNRRNK
ncbi:MAG: hypothetical protein PHW83_08130 [Bacteroidales bacterium]|nr:hypothetical protein [Bacteroidales bacterium]